MEVEQASTHITAIKRKGANATQITLDELLNAREERVRTQAAMLREHRVPLICFTMNVAGPVKTSPLIERAFGEGVRLIDGEISPYEVLERREEHTNCGPVSFYSVRADANVLKARMVDIEQKHPIGRLFDIDVIDVDGRKMSRQGERGCMVCGAPGRACAAGRLHPVSELIALTNSMLTDYFTDLDARRIARIAKESLLREVYTSPKPGLVDPVSRGSHTDMDVADFERSAEALEPYFRCCVKAGASGKSESYEKTFLSLRESGLAAEECMYAATRGVNTHKGAIFSMGILLGAIGRLMSPDGYMPSVDEILSEAARLSSASIKRDFESIDGATAGGRAYIECGMRGIRGEVIDGFPSVKKIAIPAYRAALARGKNKNDAGAITLLHLIANVYDTTLYKRGGKAGVLYARDRASELLSSGDPTVEDIRQMDAELIERNLSPGGCADLLAVTYFLTELENEKSIF